MEGLTVGKDGWAVGWMDGWTDRWSDERMDERMDISAELVYISRQWEGILMGQKSFHGEGVKIKIKRKRLFPFWVPLFLSSIFI